MGVEGVLEIQTQRAKRKRKRKAIMKKKKMGERGGTIGIRGLRNEIGESRNRKGPIKYSN